LFSREEEEEEEEEGKNLTGLYVGQAKNYIMLQVARRRILCGSIHAWFMLL